LVDLHCHILPGLDDGAADWDESLAMARMAAADGMATIIATAHQLGGNAKVSAEAIRSAAVRMQLLLDERAVPLRVLPGADVRIEPDMVAKVLSGEVLTLADRRRHVLLELPHEVYFPLDRLLDDLRAAGMVGILSHPERNRGILGRPDTAHDLVNQGMLLQITSGSLWGMFGPRVQALAEWLVKQGLVHFIASDAHATKSRCPVLSAGWEIIAELAGTDAADALCRVNPGRVANGEMVSGGCRSPKNHLVKPWFRRKWII
jgi:protein-tyrosine phosphatase